MFIIMREEKTESFDPSPSPRNSVISLPVYAKEAVCDAQDFMNNGLLPAFKRLLSAVPKKKAAGTFTHNS